MNDATEIAVDVRNAVKRYGDFTALQQISLSIRDNEFFTLLGPSGCGKTTLLRMIAGFEDVTEGGIYLFGDEIKSLPPHKRPVNTVFQNYALFPHMTVLENIGFGLEMKGSSRADAAKRAGEMLELVQLTQFARRKPSQLSGGQQQQLAIARALITRPKVLLLDEPTEGIQPNIIQQIGDVIRILCEQGDMAIVLVEQFFDFAYDLGNEFTVMKRGEVVLNKRSDDLDRDTLYRQVSV